MNSTATTASNEGRHRGRVALVTGGASGIGRAIALRLAREGARVAILDVADTRETVDVAVREGAAIAGHACDITDPAAVNAAVATVTRAYAAPTILVHSAVYQFVKAFDDVTFDEWRRVQAVNHESMFHLLKATLPGMKAAGWGRVIAIASSTFFVGAHGMTHYVTSKGALIGLVHGLAGEVGRHGITVNAVAPGLTRTAKAVGDLPPALFEHVASLQAIPRNGTPEDQAGAVSFLASDDAAFVTGQTMLVDGGQGRT
jgi:NAD(P)-dependent dehydrogenase (short-subunit alcohol dehydrogenase family)